jgi:hypothetical protein
MDRSSGARVTYTPSGGLNPVRSISILNAGNYEPIDVNKNYTIAIHDGLLLGINLLVQKLHLPIDLSHQVDTGIETWSAMWQWVAKNPVLRIDDYVSGFRYNKLEGDLVIYEQDIKFKRGSSGGTTVVVDVHNDGLAASAAAKLRILRSSPNDMIGDSTGQEKTAISADAPVRSLAPGEHLSVEVPWSNVAGAGVYSLAVQLIGADGKAVGNPVVVHKAL